MYRESVSTFADLSVTLGGAPRHVLVFSMSDFLETVGASLVRGPGCQLVVAMMCDADDSNNAPQESI